MKHHVLSALPVSLLLACVPVTPATAQGTAFTYQGRLDDSGGPANGTYDLRFALYDAASGGGALAGPQTNTAVAINDGLFTVTLDFGPGAFPGANRFLEIGIQTNGAAGFVTLSPRQQLLPVPYAATAGNLSGPVPDARLSTNVARLNASQTFTGSLGFGFSTRQMLNLYDVTYGIGVQNNTLYQRTAAAGGFAWYQGGSHSDAQNDPGPGGTALMTLDAYGDLSLPGLVTGNGGLAGTSSGVPFGTGVSGNDPSGNLNSSGVAGTSAAGKGVFGSTASASPSSAGVWGENPAAGGTALVAKAAGANSTGLFALGTGNAGFFQGNVTVTGDESFGAQTRQMIDLWVNGAAAYGIGVQNAAFYQRTANEFLWYKGGKHSDTFGDPGPGGTQLMRLGNSGTLYVAGGVVTPTVQLSGAPGLDFGSSTRQMINLFNWIDGTSYAVGVQANREYFRAAGTNGSGFAWFAGGSHVDAQDNAGPGGVQLMKLEYGPADGCAGGGGSKFCGPGALLYVWGSVWSRDSSYAYSFESLSDRDQKTGFEPLDVREILDRVAVLPITSWAFTNRTDIRHIGPMAQDFHAAFDVGMDEKHISTTDEGGVALAAIQGLNQKLETELQTKEAEIGELQRRLAQLERILSSSNAR